MSELCRLPAELFELVSQYLDGFDIVALWFTFNRSLQHLMSILKGIKSIELENTGYWSMGFPHFVEQLVGLEKLVVRQTNTSIGPPHRIWSSIKGLKNLRIIHFDFPGAFLWLETVNKEARALGHKNESGEGLNPVQHTDVRTDPKVDGLVDLSVSFPQLSKLYLYSESMSHLSEIYFFNFPSTLKEIHLIPSKYMASFLYDLPPSLEYLYVDHLVPHMLPLLPKSLLSIKFPKYQRVEGYLKPGQLDDLPPNLIEFTADWDFQYWYDTLMKDSKITILKTQVFAGFNLDRHLHLLPSSLTVLDLLPSTNSIDETIIAALPRTITDLRLHGIILTQPVLDTLEQHYIPPQPFDFNKYPTALVECWPPRLTRLRLLYPSHVTTMYLNSLPKSTTALVFEDSGNHLCLGRDLPRQLSSFEAGGIRIQSSDSPWHSDSCIDLPPSLTDIKLTRSDHFVDTESGADVEWSWPSGLKKIPFPVKLKNNNLLQLPPALTSVSVVVPKSTPPTSIKEFMASLPRLLTLNLYYSAEKIDDDPSAAGMDFDCFVNLPPHLTDLTTTASVNVGSEIYYVLPRTLKKLSLRVNEFSQMGMPSSLKGLPRSLSHLSLSDTRSNVPLPEIKSLFPYLPMAIKEIFVNSLPQAEWMQQRAGN